MLGASQKADADASRRIRPGTRAEYMQEGPPLVELQQIDSAFQLTEHLKALHNEHTQSCHIAVDKKTAQLLAQPPPGVERGIWLYELCRFLTQKANMMATALFADDPPCSAATCPEMRASEWQYLCAAHEPPKSCCAIDYCCHTLDWCATALTSTKLFPSRLGLGTEAASAQVQIRKMTEVFRRVYRIFAHAWFSHRHVFWQVESKTGLYLLFKTVCDEYLLIPDDNYTIPPDAEGIETTPVTAPRPAIQPILQRATPDLSTAKRHRHTMSVGERSVSVSTVIHEEVEDDEDLEQQTSHAAPELTRVDTVRQVEHPTDHEQQQPEEVEEDEQSKQEIHVEDPPPYPENSTEPEADTKHDTENETDVQEASSSKPTHDTETEEQSYPSTGPPSYAEVATASERAETLSTDDHVATAEDDAPTETTSHAEDESEDTAEQNSTEKTTPDDLEPETESENTDTPSEEEEKANTETQDKDASEPLEANEAQAADETEANEAQAVDETEANEAQAADETEATKTVAE
jgi:hypothetical protein